MREILFRGKLNNGSWAYGNLEVKTGGICIITPDDTPIGSYGQVIPETVGQYTGLTDKNGTKIFEGDICKHRSNYSGNSVISVVTYTDGHFLASVDKHSGFELSEKLEIIGNIHDNPELLKDQL